jgi:hypothetical protein
MWGPLVDPGIWNQTLRVAIVKNDQRLDPNRGAKPTELSKNNWFSLFSSGEDAPPPEPISAGADIVLWYSIEVHYDVTLPTSPTESNPTTYRSASSGTVFIHGFYFAHGAEKPGLFVGTTDPAYRPLSEEYIRMAKLWFRTAGVPHKQGK